MLGYCSRSYIIVTDNLTKIFQLNCLISNLTKLFFAKLYTRICPLLLILYQFSAICYCDLCNIRLLLSWGEASIFQFPTSPPFYFHPLHSCEAAPSYTIEHVSKSGSDVSSAGVEPRPTTHYVPVKLLIEAGSLIQAASSI